MPFALKARAAAFERGEIPQAPRRRSAHRHPAAPPPVSAPTTFWAICAPGAPTKQSTARPRMSALTRMPSPSGREGQQLGFAGDAEADDVGDLRLAGARLQAFGIGAVGRDQRRAARQQAFEDFRLGVGDGFAIAEEFQMRRRDGGDQRHMRAHEGDQIAQSRRNDSCRFRKCRIRHRAAATPATAARPSDCCSWRRWHGCGPAHCRPAAGFPWWWSFRRCR